MIPCGETELVGCKKPYLYPELVTDPICQVTMQERWKVVYPYLKGVVNDIRKLGTDLGPLLRDETAITTKAAIQKHKNNFTDWSGDENIASYEEVIENFVTVYGKRLGGMNSLITSRKFVK